MTTPYTSSHHRGTVVSFRHAYNLRLASAKSKTESKPQSVSRSEPHNPIQSATAEAAHVRDPASRDAQHAALIQAAAGGDARAFEQFYKTTASLVHAVVRRIVGPDHVEDVLSDSYFQAWQQANKFDAERASALTWLLTIARSRALDRVRVERLRHGGQMGAPEFDANALNDDLAPGPDTLLNSLQTSHQLHAQVAQLSTNERWMIGLAFFRDLSQSEIATLTGLPLGTVKSLLTRSQHKLREALTLKLGMPEMLKTK